MITTGSSRAIEASQVANICNLTINTLWDRYDWRWTLGKFPPFWLQPRYQDFGLPVVVIPSDFAGLRMAELVVLAGSQALETKPVQCIRDIKLTSRSGWTESIGYVPEKNCMRVYPRVPDGMGAPQYMIRGRYKKTATLITPSNYQSTKLPSDSDLSLNMWMKTAKWAQASLSGLPPKILNEMWQEAMIAIADAGRSEGLDIGETQVGPSQSLIPGYGGSWWR